MQFILAGPVHHNALTNCAARICRACVELILCVAVRSPTLRIGCERHGRKNPLPFPYFSQRSHIGNLRQTLQGKGVIHKRVETAGVYPLMLPRRVPQSPAASAAVPRCATAHSSPRNGEPFTRFGHTGKSVPRNLRSKSARRSALLTFSLVQCRKMRYTYFI